MTLTIDPNSQKAVFKIQNLNRMTRRAVELGSWHNGKGLIKATSKEILKKPKSGRLYIRKVNGRRRKHRASSPGETHANMTGTLRKSLDFKVRQFELEFGYGVTKGNAPDYARFVEFGTSKAAPRPSLQNGIRGERRNMINNYEREFKRQLK